MTDAVQASEGSTQPQKMIKIIELGGVATSSGKCGDEKAFCLIQGVPANFHGRDYRQPMINELLCKRVLFLNLLPGPASRAIKFHDHRLGILNADLVHPVLVAIQCEQAQIAPQTNRLNTADHAIRRQSLIGVGHGSPLW